VSLRSGRGGNEAVAVGLMGREAPRVIHALLEAGEAAAIAMRKSLAQGSAQRSLEVPAVEDILTVAIKDRIGVCLQATNLPDKMKVHEALQLFDAFYTRHSDQDKLLKRLQLWEKKDAFYKSLSGGQKQRVALALALLNDPALLFLDEPTTGVDAATEEALLHVVRGLVKAGMPVLMTTHDLDRSPEWFDRLMVVDRKVLAEGDPASVLESGAYGDIREHAHVHGHIRSDRA